ncbi:MAG TPA: protein kinase [Thermoanaerobaculia bacterium]|nr:protein kinase [Thermoanaerobaculia bacterium]
MTLANGTRLGPYEILSPLGAGGMGEVYRAHDAKLNRDVAIKVLPQAVASDSERLARFRREAQVLASLNHPHVAAIYGLEHSDGVDALVLELVEGETLAERLALGPLPLDEALEVARQIARALEAAHDRGIVHRDLKPANVKLTPRGEVKVLDFGLAKALATDGSAPDVTSSPTLTAAATQAGVILGTAAYMSPEQARGKAVDRRADVWAWGAVLYEMLTGRRAFEGETVSDTLAAVLTRDPDWTALPAATPLAVQRVLRRCLDRDPKTRLHDVADARLDLDEPLEAGPAAAAANLPPRSRAPLAVSIAALALLAAAGWWLALRPRPAAERVAPLRFAVNVPEQEQIPFDDMPVMDLSRDGTRLVFVAERDGRRQLYLRSWEQVEVSVVSGTEGATAPFFSPDGQWIGFFADGKLKKVPAGGGVGMTLADAPNTRGGVWLTDDTIVFAPDFTSALMRIPARGGKAEPLTQLDAKAGERSHRWPTWLPGSDAAVLFTVGLIKSPGNYDDARIAVWESSTGKPRTVYEGGSMGRWAPTGHLLFLRSETLFAVPFDARSRKTDGPPVALNERTAGDPSSGVGYVAVATNGTLAFIPASGAAAERSLVLTDISGKPRPVPVPPRSYHYPRFSPDGKRLAVAIGPGHGSSDDVWTVDLETGALTRLTIGDGNGNYYPVWSSDGRRIAYTSDRAHQGIWLKSADGTGVEAPFWPDARPELPSEWSRDGTKFALMKNFPSTDVNVVSLPDQKPLLVEPGGANPTFSPDGKWVAYGLVVPGTATQIMVSPASGAGGKVQITSDRGVFPVWTDRGIYFHDNKKMRLIEVQTEPTFRASAIHELFDIPYDKGSQPLREYDVTRDGNTFVFVSGYAGREWKQLNVALGWAAELTRIAPAGKK